MNYGDTAPSGPTIVYISRPRKDGRILCTFCYPRRLRKLKTAGQVQELKDNPEYQLRGASK